MIIDATRPRDSEEFEIAKPSEAAMEKARRALDRRCSRLHPQSLRFELVRHMNLFIDKYSYRVFALLLVILLCLGADQAGAGDATALVKIHLPGYSTNSLPFLIADEMGFYRDEGIRIEIIRIQTGSEFRRLWRASSM